VEALEERCLLAGITEFGSGSSPGSSPSQIARGSDGNLWFTEPGNNALGRITPAGGVTEFSLAGLQANSGPLGITSRPNGLLYFTESGVDRVGSINPLAGTDAAVLASLRQSKVVPSGNGSGGAGLDGIAVGSDRNLWFTESTASAVGSITPDLATITEFPTPTAAASPAGITTGPDGALWFTESAVNQVGRLPPPGTITTVAGNGTASFGGDGGPATAAQLWHPSGVAVDAAGDLFIADYENNRVREVSPSGTITTVAGGGTSGLGDGGPATAAELVFPSGVAVDAAGDLFIADQDNNRIRKVSPSGIITTVAGNGTYGFGGDGGPATAAELRAPGGLAVNAAGDLFIADAGNSRVRKVSPSGVITTVAGNGTDGFGGDGGPATAAELTAPGGLALDAGGDLYIADVYNNRIRKVSPSGIITTVAGSGGDSEGDGGPATAAALIRPGGVAVGAAGNLYIADSGNVRVREVSPSGIITTAAGGAGLGGFSGDGGPATAAGLDPGAVALDAAGDLYIADVGNNRIRKVTSLSGTGITEFALPSGSAPQGITTGPDGNLWFTENGSPRIGTMTTAGAVTEYPVPSGSAAARITAGSDGNLWFTEPAGNRIGRVTPAGQVTEYGSGITAGANPLGITSGPDGNLWFTEPAGNRVGRLIPDASLSVAGTPVSATATVAFSGPVATFTDADTSAVPGDYAVTIDWGDGSTTGGPVAAVSGKPGSFTVSGTHVYTAAGSDLVQVAITDTNTTTSVGGSTATISIPVTVAAAATATALTASANPVGAGQPLTFTATVSSSGIGAPTGTVTFLDTTTGTTLGTAPLDNSGTATQAVGGLAQGSHSIKATYGGDPSFASSSASLTETVNASQAPAFTSAGDTTFAVGAAGTFPVTATGLPAPTLSESGSDVLPAGVTFTAGTGVLGGTPAAGSAGTYTLHFTASNSVGSASQTFTLTVAKAPAFTSAGGTTFVAGTADSFTVTASGFPVPSLSESTGDTLPAGVGFSAATGVLSGTPASGSAPPYTLHFTAHNGVSSDATQTFTLTVVAPQAPTITSAAATTFTVGTAGSFTVTATGAPAPTLSESSGDSLPGGVTFNPVTGVLSGTPAARGVYPLQFTAHNGVGSDVTQTFTLTVNWPPTFTGAAGTTFTVGAAGSFTVAATGSPAPTLSEKPGEIPPAGVTFDAATGLLSGTPMPGTGNAYTLNFTATSSAGSVTQAFALTVDEAPSFTSPDADTLLAGTAASFRVTARGFPVPTLSESTTDTRPPGLGFNPAVGGVGGSAVGLLSGTLAATSGGAYTLHFAATNGIGVGATQAFSLTVDQTPAFTNPTGAAFTTGAAGAFRVAAAGFPPPALSESGALPAGVTFDPVSGVLGGTPAPGTAGSYAVSFSAGNGVGTPATQAFTLTVTAPAPPVPPPITGPLNLAGLVGVSVGPLAPVGKRRKTGGSFTQTVTVTNNGPSAIQGPIVLVLDSLTPRKKVRKKFVPQVTVAGAGGTTQTVSPGSPFVPGPALLPAGGMTSFRLTFQRKGAGTITFNPVLLAGYTQP
jgi:streptogramin lyase